MDVIDFLPSYPTDNVSTELYARKEFREFELDEKMGPIGSPLKHQNIITRYLSPYTLYDELLLFHYPGTGKTCTSIRAIENSFQVDYGINKAIIILPNKELIRKFKEEILFVCTDNKYVTTPEDMEGLSEAEKREKTYRASWKNIKNLYRIYTVETFYRNVLAKLSDAVIRKQFSNSFIVLDEVHNLVTNEEQSKMYERYHDFLHLVTNRKIVLMTGTPMKNDATEFAFLMNLILPKDEQLPTNPAEFSRLTNGDIGDVIDGRVSYLKSKTGINVKFEGSKVGPITFNNIFPPPRQSSRMGYLHMSEPQLSSYRKAMKEDLSGKGWFKASREASSFVFPDGSYGADGFAKYIRKSGRSGYQFTTELTNKFRGLDTMEKLWEIAKYSSKYANIIYHIVTNPNQNCFVFSESIRGSGAIVFGLCLRLFGYRETGSGKPGAPGLRYSILSDITKTNVSEVIRSFNRKTNSNGKYIQVLIGGKKIAEGFTFRNVQQLHIATPQWNYSNIEQVIARGNRLFAHRNLPSGSVMRVFLHAAYSPDIQADEFIDLRMYLKNQEKDSEIKRIEYLIKTYAMDCMLNKKRNIERSYPDYHRRCDYQPCAYTCADEKVLPVNYQTYTLYYNSESVKKIHEQLVDLLKSQFIVDVQSFASNYQFQYTDVIQAIVSIIKLKIPVEVMGDVKRFVQESDGKVFLTSSPLLNPSYLDVYYTRHPTSLILKTVENRVESIRGITLERINSIKAMPRSTRISLYPTFHPQIQELFIEAVLTRYNQGVRTPVIDWAMKYYAPYIRNNRVSTFLKDEVRVLNPATGTWFSVDENAEATRLSGTYKNQKFAVSTPGNQGRVCDTMAKMDLLKLLSQLGLKPTSSTKRGLCHQLEKYFLDQNLIS